jgi:DNA-binding GntR family transcriptional regulator
MKKCAMSDEDLQITKQAATLRLRVEEKLRGAIASGRFKPGERLIERELCGLLGVGRTSVREALRQLEAEGLILTIPHRGPVVASIGREEARQLYAVRALLEGYAARGFAAHADAEQVERLGRAVEALETAAAGDSSLLIKAKTTFYQVLLEGCGNEIVRQLLTGLHNRITLLRSTSMARPGRLPESLREIRGIYELIAARDTDGAEAACIAHVDSAAEAALAVLADDEDQFRSKGSEANSELPKKARISRI